MDRESAIVQGAFLLANKQCLPSSLSSLQKADWSRVRPTAAILAALADICGEDATRAACWKKKLVCVVWLKLLCREVEEDVETTWRESPFFALHYGLPDVSHVLLLELVKSMSAAGVFARLLLRLPRSQLVAEVEQLTQHVRCSPTSEDDVRFFLDLWWELWKGSDEAEDGIETVFAEQFARMTSSPAGTAPQAAKRMKLDPSAPASNTDILHILLHALKDLKEHVSSSELCLIALTVSLESLYTSFLIQQSSELPSKEKLLFLSKAVAIREKNGEKLSAQLLQELLRDLRASRSPSAFQPSQVKLADAVKIVTELAQFWQSGGLLEACGGSHPSYTAFKLQQGVERVLAALEDVSEVTEDEKGALRAVQESLAFPDVESSSQQNAHIAMNIISHRLDDYQNFAALFAEVESWAACDEQWASWLEKNQAAFREHGTLIRLASTLSRKLHADGSDVNQCRKLMKVVADIFSALPLEDKNKSLAVMLRQSSRGLFDGSVPPAVSDAFKQELNMAFNCIIQVGGGTAATQGSLNTAVSLVARVAFQNPEAALRSCCHAAIFNKGAFSLMAKILQQLPGLRGHTGPSEADGRSDGGESSLLCTCLQEEMRSRSPSSSEKEQFISFVGLLMVPVVTAQGDSMQLLPPQELVSACVLQNLSTTGHSSIDLELSLQLLHTALSADMPDDAASPHWVMDCSPFPLLYMLAQLHDQALRCWEQPPEGAIRHWSMDTKELLESVLTSLAAAVGREVAAAPSSWSRALFWLYDKVEGLDWTVRFHLKPLWGDHFKNEVPASLLTVCALPEQEWSALDLPQYGQGTGLLAWMECCALSDPLRSVMLSNLSLDQRQPDHVSMFSKGLLVALTQTLPWCNVSQWSRILGALRELLASGRLHVPFSLEYVDFLPLLDLRKFSRELCLSVMLLRVLQLLCGSSCSDWLTGDAWAHVGRLYAHAMREMMDSLRAKLPLPAPAASSPPKALLSGDSGLSCSPARASKTSPDSLTEAKVEKDGSVQLKCPQIEENAVTNLSQEVLFVLSQFFCHVQHIQVMMPGGQCEPLFLSSLDILSHYEAVMTAFPDSSSPLESDNTRHFFSTITDNLQNQEMKAVLQQKIAQLISPAA